MTDPSLPTMNAEEAARVAALPDDWREPLRGLMSTLEATHPELNGASKWGSLLDAVEALPGTATSEPWPPFATSR